MTVADRVSLLVIHNSDRGDQEFPMSKGMDQKKSEKKKPQKTLEEKRAAKKEKKANKR
jgi:hypothetical protein